MVKKRFSEILREYGYTAQQIDLLWKTKPPVELDEETLRKTAKHLAPIKDSLIQA